MHKRSHPMRTVFLCHASEDKTAAERIQLALASAGYKVFFDEESLPPGGDYHARIREAIRECDIFIFLISTSSVAQGKFTLTELKFARDRWPSPVGRVLPVNLDNLSTTEIPAYLTATTMLFVAGNLASEVRAATEQMLLATTRKVPFRTIIIGVVITTLALAVGVWRLRSPRALPPTGQRPLMGPLEHGWGYDHNDLNPLGWTSVTTPEACSDLCYMRSDCKAMTYVISNKSCWLKYAVPARIQNGDMISAVKTRAK